MKRRELEQAVRKLKVEMEKSPRKPLIHFETAKKGKLPWGIFWNTEVIRNREVDYGVSCEFDLAEENIGLIWFANRDFEVGIGEVLRPYQLLYRGFDLDEAWKVFAEAVRKHSGMGGGDGKTESR